jgi:signal transduction histidine kinase
MPRLRRNGPSDNTILVVDDQEDALGATQALLEREGHRVLPCATGAEALTRFAANDVQLVLVDYCMPTMSGPELIAAIRERDEFVQIVMQTGFAGPKPPRTLLAELDIQGYHNKADGPDALLMWVDVGLKAHKLVTRLRERERMHSDLVANVSHEFRTPLNIIAGYAEMLLDEGCGHLPDPAAETVKAIARTNRSLGALVDNFLQYARVDAGVAEAGDDRNVTAELVRELEILGTLLVQEGDVRFAATCTDCVPATFLADSVKVRTVLRNLIGNAAKFTRRGTITLAADATDDSITFAVCDTGPGIAADVQQAVFEPFRQLAGARTHGGVGLGLALSCRLAQVLGGSLMLESTVGTGSTFTLTIPRRLPEGEIVRERSAIRARAGAA